MIHERSKKVIQGDRLLSIVLIHRLQYIVREVKKASEMGGKVSTIVI